MVTSEFKLNTVYVLNSLTGLEPINIIKSLYGQYGFDTGRAIDSVYDFYLKYNFQFIKNSPNQFIKFFYEKERVLEKDYKDWVHIISLPAKGNHQLTLSLNYLKQNTFARDNEDFSLILYLNKLDNADEYLGSTILNLNLNAFVAEHGLANIDTLLLLSVLERPWEIEAEEALGYARRIVALDAALNEL